VGWRDRDWARLSDDELKALYGVQRREPAAHGDETPAGGAPRRTVSTRQVSWTLVVIACVAVAGLAYAAGPSSSPLSPDVAPLQRGVVYGAPLTFAGTPTACTEIAYNTAFDGWSCLQIDANTEHLPVVQPPSYQGPCAHLVVDEARDRWECLGSVPMPANELPPAVLPGGASAG